MEHANLCYIICGGITTINGVLASIIKFIDIELTGVLSILLTFFCFAPIIVCLLALGIDKRISILGRGISSFLGYFIILCVIGGVVFRIWGGTKIG